MLYAIGGLRLLPRPLPTWLAICLLFAAYAVTAGPMLLYAEHFVSARVDSDLFPLPWIADGIAVSLMLLWGTRTWPAVFLGSIFIWGAMRGDAAILVGVDAIGETASVLITVQILRACHFRRQLDRLFDPLILLLAAVAGRVVAGLADVGGTIAGVWLTPHSVNAEFLSMATRPGTQLPGFTWGLAFAMARWQLNATAGIVLTLPVLLTSPRRLLHVVRTRPLRLTAFGALSVLWMTAALQLTATWTCWPLLLAALMLVTWATIEFSTLAAAVCTLIFSCTAAAACCQGLGPLATTDLIGDLTATWGFIGLLGCISPVLTVVLSARQRQDRRLGMLAERYRSLFTANPTPAWVVDAGSGAILMANVEAVRRYGYSESEFLAMKAADLCAESPSPSEPPPPDSKLVAAPLIKHVTSDGRLIDVELVSTPLELDGQRVTLLHAVDMTDQQDLRRRLLATVDRESFRVSRELHDGLGQLLTGLAAGSEVLLKRTESARVFDAEGAAQLRELSRQAQLAESHLFQLTSSVSSPDERQGDPQAAPKTDRPAAGARTSGRRPARPAGRVAPLSVVGYLGASALIVLTCWAGGVLSHALASAHNSHLTYADPRLAVPSLLSGVVVATLLQRGVRYLPAIFLAMVLQRLGQMGEPLLTAMLLSVLGLLGISSLVALLKRLRFSPALERWWDPLLLCAAAGITWAAVMVAGIAINALMASLGTDNVSPGVAALFVSSKAQGVTVTPAVLGAAARWWFDAVVGTVLVVPTLTLAGTLRVAVRDSLPELGCWCAGLGVWLLLLLAVPANQVLLPLLTASILLVVWAAARLGVALASLATLVFAMTAAGSFATHTGAFATADASTGVAYVWGFVGVLTVISLFLAALLAEHNRHHREIAAVGKRYRSLFHGDPRPLWLHDSGSGQILEANEPAARAYGYSMAEFTSLRVSQLFAAGMSFEEPATPGDRAIGPLSMRHQKKNGGALDVEMWSYAMYLDGRRVSICFAHDVTERNTLRRLLFDRAELERRQLASELRRALAGPLAELRIVAHKLLLEHGRRAKPDRIRELLESLTRQAQRTAERCREAAQQLSPIRANGGDLVAALQALRQQTPAAAPLRISVTGAIPLTLGQQQTERVYGLLSELVRHCPAAPSGNDVHVEITHFGHTVRLSLDADLPRSEATPAGSLARHPSVLLRVRTMGARLWERSLGGVRTRVVCDCPL